MIATPDSDSSSTVTSTSSSSGEKIETPFASLADADAAYYDSTDDDGSGDSGGTGGGDSNESGEQWGQLDVKPTGWKHWNLAFQSLVSGDRRRWFVLRLVDDGETQTFEGVNSAGNVVSTPRLDAVPQYDVEQDARDAYAKWVDAHSNPDTTPSDTVSEWNDWTAIQEVTPWWLNSRTHKTDPERVQFAANGVTSDGTAVYLAQDGSASTSLVTFESQSALTAALDAYFQKVQNGDIPTEQQPTGEKPAKSVIERDSKSSESESKVKETIEKLGGKKVLLAAFAVVALVVIYQQRIQ